jgi:hypothetical protein
MLFSWDTHPPFRWRLWAFLGRHENSAYGFPQGFPSFGGPEPRAVSNNCSRSFSNLMALLTSNNCCDTCQVWKITPGFKKATFKKTDAIYYTIYIYSYFHIIYIHSYTYIHIHRKHIFFRLWIWNTPSGNLTVRHGSHGPRILQWFTSQKWWFSSFAV